MKLTLNTKMRTLNTKLRTLCIRLNEMVSAFYRLGGRLFMHLFIIMGLSCVLQSGRSVFLYDV